MNDFFIHSHCQSCGVFYFHTLCIFSDNIYLVEARINFESGNKKLFKIVNIFKALDLFQNYTCLLSELFNKITFMKVEKVSL